MSPDISAPQMAPRSRAWLGAEFALLFLAAPVAMALFISARWMFPVLGVFTLTGLVLLAITPGFRWREMWDGAGRIGWGLVLTVTAATLIASLVIISLTYPEARWSLLRYNPVLLAMIALLYPFLSALPQEIVFRLLFFRRYGAILPRRAESAVVLNALIFSLAHLMYWSWVVAAMTFAGGLVFAASYRLRGNFAEAVVAHVLAGIVVFASGLGIFFYSGNVTRPF